MIIDDLLDLNVFVIRVDRRELVRNMNLIDQGSRLLHLQGRCELERKVRVSAVSAVNPGTAVDKDLVRSHL